MNLYMFRAVLLPIIRSPFTVHLSLVYNIQVWRQLSNRAGMEIQCQTYSEWTPDDGQRKCPKHV